MPITGDTVRFYFPSWAIGRRLLNEGFYFLWDPYRLLGHPFAANPSFQPFYPARIAFFFLDYFPYQKISVFFHTLLSSFFGFLIGRNFTQTEKGAWFLGILFAFNGLISSRIGYTADFCSLAWAPVALYCFLKGKPGLLGLSLALQWLAGFPPVSLLTLASLFILAGFWGRLKIFWFGVLWMLGFIAFQFLPFLELLGDSNRGIFLKPEASFEKSLTLSLILKNLFLSPFVSKEFWVGNSLLKNFYLGPVFSGLFLFGLFWAYRRDRKIFYLGIFSLLFLALSLGGNLPLHSFVPGMTLFRFPSTFALGFVILGGLVSAYGISKLKNKKIFIALIFFLAIDFLAFGKSMKILKVEPEFFRTGGAFFLPQFKKIKEMNQRVLHFPPILERSPAWENTGEDWALLKGILTPSLAAGYGVKEVISHSNLIYKRNIDLNTRLLWADPQSPLFDYAGILGSVVLTKEALNKTKPDLNDFRFIPNKEPAPRGFFLESLSGAKILMDKPGKAIFAPSQSGKFIFSESFSSGWTANVDGEKINIQPFEDALMTIIVPKGSKRIQFQYQPKTFFYGLIISLGSVSIWAIFPWLKRRIKRLGNR